MTTQIHKFALPHVRENLVQMPAGARVLSAAFQGFELQLWAEVEPNAKLVERRIEVIGTGWPLWHDNDNEPGAFVGTAFCQTGLVFHVFDLGEAV